MVLTTANQDRKYIRAIERRSVTICPCWSTAQMWQLCEMHAKCIFSIARTLSSSDMQIKMTSPSPTIKANKRIAERDMLAIQVVTRSSGNGPTVSCPEIDNNID